MAYADLGEFKRYGTPNKQLVEYAYNFLFSHELRNPELWQEFEAYVNKKYNRLGCVVIWPRSCPQFSSQKEVVITSSSVRTSNDYLHNAPMISYALGGASSQSSFFS